MQRTARKAFWMQLAPLLAGFLVLAIIIGARGLLIEAQRRDNDAALASLAFAQQLAGVFSLLQDAETSQRGFLLTAEQSYLEPYDAARLALPRELTALKRATEADPGQATHVAKLAGLVVQKLDELETTVDLVRRSRSVEAIEAVRSGSGKRLMDEIRAVVAEIQRAEAATLDMRLASSVRLGRFLSIGSIISLVALVIVASLSVMGSRRRIRDIVAAHADLARANDALSREMQQKEAAETQLRQLQKMEAIGQLTGGIAHDFNNMIAVVTSAMNLMQRKLARGETDVQKFVEAASDAASRAAALTARLLAFSRQQPLAPEVVDANRLIGGMSELLSRTLGEQVRVETVLAGGLWKTKADASQLENAVLNLAVNGRDAMPEGGRLTVETANAHLDDAYAAAHAGVPAGQYVMLAVTDTGTGMTPEVMAKAFDPYFTTKPVGKGTGLGLSQVFGFVRQSGGHVKIYSEPGQGTTVKIYLPRQLGDEPGQVRDKASGELAARPGETVLVVEDDDRVRALTVAALHELGYAVRHASGAVEALALLRDMPDLSLLFTDIVMPEVDGRKLADQALKLRPGLKVLFTTGFTRNAIVHNGVLDHGVNFLAKPFTLDQLAAKLRAVLDARA